MAAHKLTLLSRRGCHLCETARADLDRIAADFGIPVTETNVDSDTELRAEYGDRIPVILIDGVEHGFWRVEEPRLRRALSA